MLRIDTPKQDLETNCIGDANHKRETKTCELSWSPKYQRPSPLRSPHPVDHAKVAVPVSPPPLPRRSTNIPSIHSRLRVKPRAGAPAQGPRTEEGPVTRQTLAAVLMISWLPFKANWADNVCCFMSKVSLGVYCWSFQAKSCCLLQSFRNAPIPWHVALIVPSISQAARYEWGFKQICQFLVLTNSDRSLYNSNKLARDDECWTRIADEQRCCTCLHAERKQTWGFNMIYSARMGIYDFNTFVGTYIHFYTQQVFHIFPYHGHSFIHTPHPKKSNPTWAPRLGPDTQATARTGAKTVAFCHSALWTSELDGVTAGSWWIPNGTGRRGILIPST